MKSAVVAMTLVVLVLASGASAKNMTVAQACGPDECVTLRDRQHLTALLGGGGIAPPPTAAYYRLDFTFESPDGAHRVTHSSLYVPSKQLAATEGPSGEVVWFPVDRAAAGLMARATSDLEPFAAPSAWPARYGDGAFSRTMRRVEGDMSWTAWLAGIAVLLALGVGVLFARGRVRRPEIA